MKLIGSIASVAVAGSSLLSGIPVYANLEKPEVIIVTSRINKSDTLIYQQFSKEYGLRIRLIEALDSRIIQAGKAGWKWGNKTRYPDVIMMTDINELVVATNAGFFRHHETRLLSQNNNQREQISAGRLFTVIGSKGDSNYITVAGLSSASRNRTNGIKLLDYLSSSSGIQQPPLSANQFAPEPNIKSGLSQQPSQSPLIKKSTTNDYQNKCPNGQQYAKIKMGGLFNRRTIFEGCGTPNQLAYWRHQSQKDSQQRWSAFGRALQQAAQDYNRSLQRDLERRSRALQQIGEVYNRRTSCTTNFLGSTAYTDCY